MLILCLGGNRAQLFRAESVEVGGQVHADQSSRTPGTVDAQQFTSLLASYDADYSVRADALPRQTDHQTCELLLRECVLLWFAATVRPGELSLVQTSRCQPDPDSVVNHIAGTKVDNVLSGRGNSGRPYKRPNFPMDFKRQLAELSFEPGASVALIARQNDINANLLFKWRRQYLEGAYGLPTVPAHATPTPQQPHTSLLPVAILDDQAKPMPTPPASTPTVVDGLCEVEFDHARLRISGDVSPAMLRLLISELSRTRDDAR